MAVFRYVPNLNLTELQASDLSLQGKIVPGPPDVRYDTEAREMLTVLGTRVRVLVDADRQSLATGTVVYWDLDSREWVSLPIGTPLQVLTVNATGDGLEWAAGGGGGGGGTAAYGELALNGNATATSLPTQNAWVKVTAGWVAGDASGMTPQVGSSDIRCDLAGNYGVVCPTSHLNAGGSNRDFQFAIFKNGALLAESVQHHRSTGTGGEDNLTVGCRVDLAINDVIDLRVRCTDAAGVTITIVDANLSLGGSGSGTVASVFGRTGVVVAVAGDYSSTLITNASAVPGATVTLALNALDTDLTAALAAIVSLQATAPTAGEKAALAGTSGTPGALNAYVTNADTRNTNARTPTAHASTHSSGGSDPITITNLAGFPGGSTNFLRADGTFAAPPGGGGASIGYVDAFASGDYYQAAIANPFSGQTLVTVAALIEIVGNLSASRAVLSSLDRFNAFDSGLSLRITGGGFNPALEYYSNAGALTASNAALAIFPYVGKLALVVFELDTSGANGVWRCYVNGSEIANGTNAGAGGALPAGSGSRDLTIGQNPGGTQFVADGIRVCGAAYKIGGTFNTVNQHAEWFLDVEAAGQLEDAPSGMTAGWRTVGADPGATWAPFVGSGDMIETGAVGYGTSSLRWI